MNIIYGVVQRKKTRYFKGFMYGVASCGETDIFFAIVTLNVFVY